MLHSLSSRVDVTNGVPLCRSVLFVVVTTRHQYISVYFLFAHRAAWCEVVDAVCLLFLLPAKRNKTQRQQIDPRLGHLTTLCTSLSRSHSDECEGQVYRVNPRSCHLFIIAICRLQVLPRSSPDKSSPRPGTFFVLKRCGCVKFVTPRHARLRV